MAYTRHGHHIPRTAEEEKPSFVLRCGGLRNCHQCSADAYAKLGIAYMPQARVPDAISFLNKPGPERKEKDRTTKDLHMIARSVVETFNHRLRCGYVGNTRIPLKVEEVSIAWYVYTIDGLTALTTTSRPDGMYYEVTYSGKKNVIYVDAYKKLDNVVLHPDNIRP